MDETAADEHVEASFESFLDDLRALVAQPSVSATGEGIEDCCALLRELCLEYGFDTAERVETSGHPVLVARAYVDNEPDNDAPTVLVYGHYDVQPVDPGAWTTPPFDPEVRDRDGEPMLYGRGTVDNKGQHFAYLCAVDTLRETTGLPANVTLLLDGEEESGSPTLQEAVDARRTALAADVSINSDGPVDDSGRPSVVLGNRGILLVSVEVDGPHTDLHSGHYGGAIPNPAWALIELLDTMKDDDGRIAVDGFYDDVRPVTDEDRGLLEATEPDEDDFLASVAVDGLAAGPGETVGEKTLYYPTLNINGLSGGHGGEGFKTIVPADASATVDMRLVVDQDPDEILERFRTHVRRHQPDGLDVRVSRLASMHPTRTPVDTPYRQPVVAAVADAWGTEPVVKPASGGSAPYALLATELDVPHLSVPYGQQDNNQHSADEHFSLEHFRKGILTSAGVLGAVASVEGAESRGTRS